MQNPNDFDNNPFSNSSNSLPTNFNQGSNLSPEEREVIKKKARRWFIILLIIGLSLGGIVAVGVVKVINELGLTNKPDHQPLKIER